KEDSESKPEIQIKTIKSMISTITKEQPEHVVQEIMTKLDDELKVVESQVKEDSESKPEIQIKTIKSMISTITKEQPEHVVQEIMTKLDDELKVVES
ncbi:MAG: hypothetical protein ACK559_10080, partial [bacterium]